ncbi:MAG TPA: glycosyltransferase family 39 protein [Anaerolineales bacterium]|nr:glycosyltransferase family 39 protein [Anaerolineales bacterium]
MTAVIGFLKKRELPPILPFVLAGAAALLYFIQAVGYAHTSVSGLDEGSYLLKGILYLRGVYAPFEPYGPFTNKAPFAFLIPGFAESLFGAGLRTGRYFSIFLGLLTLLGVWITARRWAGIWLAAGAVWVFALSPMVIKLHALAVSQVIIACMLAWICVLLLGEDRPLWQVAGAAVIAAFAVLTRQNMVVILPFLVVYAFWQHGRQKALWGLLAGGLVLLAVHLYYWPRILVIWAPWLPENLTPFLSDFRVPGEGTPIWDPSIDFWNRMNSFFQGMRYHFIPILGSLFAVILFPPRADWKSAPAFRAFLFLGLTYFTLFLMHGWASLASRYESYSCVFCFSNYLGFFDPLGVLLFVIALAHAWTRAPSRMLTVLIVFLVVALSAGMGFSLFEHVGNGLLNLPVPRVRGGQLLPGTVALVDFLRYGFNLELFQIKRVISSSLGALVGLGVALTAWFIWRGGGRSKFGRILVNSFLVAGFVLFPVLHLGEGKRDCGTDIILAHERLGEYLSSIIPPDSLVYWDGGNAFTPMVYVPHARIFPPQINNGYTFYIGGDPDELYYFSHWNAELDARWRGEADIFIIEAKRYPGWREFLNPQDFREFSKPADSPSCVEGAELRIFQRLP